MVCLKNKEFPRFGATCILAEIIMMAYLFAVLILSFLLTGDFFLPNTSGSIAPIGSTIPDKVPPKNDLNLLFPEL